MAKISIRRKMSKETFEQFRQIVLQNISLQKELRNIERRNEFTERVVQLAAEKSFEITNADVEEAISSARRAWSRRWI